MLLPPKHFEQSIELYLIEENETKDPLNTKTLNLIGQQKPHEAENSNATLPKEVSNANQKDDLYISFCTHLEDLIKYAKPDSVKLKDCKISKGLLMKKNQFWMPDDEGLQLRIIKEIYNQLAVSHSDVEQTLNMVQQHYYWPCIQQTIKQYVQNCHICRRAKAAHDIYHGLLQLLPVSKSLWVEVTIDFVTGLPKCHAYGQIYNATFMVIDRLLKKCHYIPCTKKTRGYRLSLQQSYLCNTSA